MNLASHPLLGTPTRGPLGRGLEQAAGRVRPPLFGLPSRWPSSVLVHSPLRRVQAHNSAIDESACTSQHLRQPFRPAQQPARPLPRASSFPTPSHLHQHQDTLPFHRVSRVPPQQRHLCGPTPPSSDRPAPSDRSAMASFFSFTSPLDVDVRLENEEDRQSVSRVAHGKRLGWAARG